MILEFSQSIVTLPDEECSGVKPINRQFCVGQNCSSVDGKELNGLAVNFKPSEEVSSDGLRVDADTLTEQRLSSDRLQLDRLQVLNQLAGSTNDVDSDSEETSLAMEENDVLAANTKSELIKTQSDHKWMTTGYSQCTATCLGGMPLYQTFFI
jgi:hypothetical protein